MHTHFTLYLLFITALLMLAKTGQAASISNLNITGVVRAVAKCDINGGKPITIDYEEVDIDKVDGINYPAPLSINLVCSGLPSNALRLQLTGTSAAFDSKVLSTNIKDFGIKFKTAEGKQLALNTDWESFSYPTPPVIFAVPVKKNGANLPTGSFTSSATLIIQQQ